MKRMKNMRHTFITFATAVALIVASVPATAFATSPDGGAERSDPAPEVPIIDVTVPVGFILGGDAGLDIQQLGEVQASAEFVNNSNIGVRIKEATCDAAGLNNYFEVGEGNTAKLSLVGKEMSWVPNVEGTQSIYSESSEDLREGIVFGIGDHVSTSMTLNMKDMGLKDAVIEATKERTELRNLMKISWTFERALSDFYLKIADEPQSAALAPWAGTTYTLAQVRVDSKALGSGAAAEGSDTYNRYHALVTSMAPEGDYECAVRYDGQWWPVRIIGLNQDYAAESFGFGSWAYREGDRVGLTFQFRDLIGSSPLAASGSSSEGGWGGENAQDMRSLLNTVTNDVDDANDTYLEKMQIKDSIVPVVKFFSSTRTGSGSITLIADKMFLASYFELSGDRDYYSNFSWIAKEGSGGGHDEQYLFYQNKGISGAESANYANEVWLKKSVGPDWDVSRVEASPPSEGDVALPTGTDWWTRSVAPGYSSCFLRVGNDGFYQRYQVWRFMGVCPCFCL